VKFEKTPEFDRDWRRLTDSERSQFRKVIRDSFNPACDRRLQDPAEAWPSGLRVKPMKSRPDVLELTWEPVNGRATFAWVIVDGEPRIRWRWIGGHAILGNP
jgi:hypothetical protein